MFNQTIQQFEKHKKILDMYRGNYDKFLLPENIICIVEFIYYACTALVLFLFQ